MWLSSTLPNRNLKFQKKNVGRGRRGCKMLADCLKRWQINSKMLLEEKIPPNHLCRPVVALPLNSS